MEKIYVLDRYTSKNLEIEGMGSASFAKLKVGDKIVYSAQDQTWVNKLSVGIYIGHSIETDRKGSFDRVMEWDEKEFFNEQQEIALEIFPMFKKLFKKYFSDSIPVTARYHVFSDQIYFYFYSEERYVFSEFVKELRELLGKNIFLFQVGARDMVRMFPGTNCIVGCNNINLCCKSSRPLPSVEIENIIIQNLEWRDIEKLKWRCGKLKCCLIYELELYLDESKKFPPKWTVVESKTDANLCGITSSFNIMNNEVTVRTEDGFSFRIPLAQIKLSNKKLKIAHKDELPPEVIQQKDAISG